MCYPAASTFVVVFFADVYIHAMLRRPFVWQRRITNTCDVPVTLQKGIIVLFQEVQYADIAFIVKVIVGPGRATLSFTPQMAFKRNRGVVSYTRQDINSVARLINVIAYEDEIENRT